MSILSEYRSCHTRWADHQLRDELKWSFRQAAIGAGVALPVDSPISGTSFHAPTITNVDLGPPVRFTVRMPEGTVPAQLQRAARLIGPYVGGITLAVTDRGFGWALVEVVTTDPLAGMVPLELPRPDRRIFVGRGEDGADVFEDLHRAAHAVYQGVTRSGKSVMTYGVLAQLAPQTDVLITGSDPTGLLWRPFAGSRHSEWQVSGLSDLAAHVQLLQSLCDEMDQRIANLPLDRDTIEITDDMPLLVTVLEEYAGLLRTADAAKTKTDDPGKTIRALVGRLLAEGAKVGVRVIILVQRAEAAVIGSFERAMCSFRMSFRIDNRASVELLHPGAPADDADAHTTSEPGIALLSRPGAPLQRVRAPFLGGYPEYAAAVAAATGPTLAAAA